MSWQEKEIERLYWQIGDVAEMFHVATSAIRFWETEFGLKFHRNSKDNRLFTKEDIAQVERIHYLLKVRKFTIEGVRQELEKPDERKTVPSLHGPS